MMDLIISISVLVIFIILLVATLTYSSSKIIHEKSFWWDTWNGLNYSKALYKQSKIFSFIKWIEYINHYKDPRSHPEYNSFLEEIKDL